MNRSQFTSFMKSPASLSPESAKLLSEVLKEFPYCQTAQLLFIKSLHLQKSIHYNNQLKIAAAYATDRTILYNLITRKEKEEIIPGTTVKPPAHSEDQLLDDLTLKTETVQEGKVLPAPSDAKTEVIAPSPIEVLQARLRELEEQSKTPAPPLLVKEQIEPEEPSVKEEPNIPQPVADVLPERNNQRPPLRKAIPVPEPENIVAPVNTDDTLKTVKDMDALSDTYINTAIDASIQLEIKTTDASSPASEPTVEPEEQESALSFADWLKKSKGEKPAGKEAPKTPVTAEKREKQSRIIEKFIQEEPRIQKPQKEFYSPVNMARQSVVEDLSFVTETLAGIYAKQGNTAKAIRAYQTLSLKYPEKKLYFASLIEKLEGAGGS
jgi:hypothetical protein